eukprot:comp24153_c1_seq1/m.43981 comp24153_c1_seq1/g.43981  ORF comp24153_c1_seq1/g.43981 comp24153_c1_seq1/m.43981 type:complete len:323 (-) comp24153_c1_seq1:705-1673(-)
MMTAAQAPNTAKMNGTVVNGAAPPQSRAAAAPAGTYVDAHDPLAPNRVFIGGLHRDADEISLREYFEFTYGPVISCRIIHDKDTGKSKGYGFVTFVSGEAAERVRQQGTITFMDKAANVGPAVRKPPYTSTSTPSSSSGSTTPSSVNGGGRNGNVGTQNGHPRGRGEGGPPRRGKRNHFNSYRMAYDTPSVAYYSVGGYMVPAEYVQQMQQQLFLAQLYPQPIYQPPTYAPPQLVPVYQIPQVAVAPGAMAYDPSGNDHSDPNMKDQDPNMVNVAALSQQIGTMSLGPSQGRPMYGPSRGHFALNPNHPAYNPLAQPAAPPS